MSKLTFVDRFDPPEIPESLFTCPICGAKIAIQEITEWYSDGSVADTGISINCSMEPDIDDEDLEEEWADFQDSHWSMPYVDWLPLQHKVTDWFNKNYRLSNI